MQKTAELEAMWVEYKKPPGGNDYLRNCLVEAYLPLVDYLAERMTERLPRCVALQDVHSAGVMGLLAAVKGFDLARGLKFETYASIRIRGSIQDELRGRDWVPRLVRIRAQKFTAKLRRLQSQLGHPPMPNEVIEHLGITQSQYDGLLRDVQRLAIYSLDETPKGETQDRADTIASSLARSLQDHRAPDLFAQLERFEGAAFIARFLLPIEQKVMTLYYFNDLSMKEVGRELNLSESRICQIHGEAISRLRKELAHYRQALAVE